MVIAASASSMDALSVYLREQETAGLDIVTDGDCRFDQDVGGQSWTSYPPHHMDGFEATHPKLAKVGAGRHRVSARPHPARLSGSARDAADRRADRARRNASTRRSSGGAAPDAEAGEVRDGDAGARGLRGPDEHYKRACPIGSWRCRRRSIRNCTTWRTPGARSFRWKSRRFICLRRAVSKDPGDYAGVHAEGLQQYGERPAREDRSVVPHAGQLHRSSGCLPPVG